MENTSTALEALAAISRDFGANENFVFLGGGNTSWKNDTELYIKPSGVQLATIQPSQFLKLDRQCLRKVFGIEAGLPDAAREELVKNLQLAAVRPAGAGRPSVEAPLHEVIRYAYVVHTHPVLVNAMTCGKKGAEICKQLFPAALWMDYCNPGSTLAYTVKEALDQAEKATGTQPKVIFLQNHGVFVAADTTDEIQAIYNDLTEKLTAWCTKQGIDVQEPTVAPADDADITQVAPVLRTLLSDDNGARPIVHSVAKAGAFQGPLTPDHIVYAKSFAYIGEATAEGIAAFKAAKGYLPRVVEIPGKGVFSVGTSLKDAYAAAKAIVNARQIERLSAAFGGVNYMTADQYGFIEHWEVESYRRSVSADKGGNRLENRICVVTGGAQGFGLGIAEFLASQGGTMVLADMNYDGANAAAQRLNAQYGCGRAFAVAVNVSDEDSVAKMMADIAREAGGIDLFVANAGVVRAGSVMEQPLKDFKFVTDINYIGYFLCVKYAAQLMSKQMKPGADDRWTDIVQVNSKSGLEGSNRNGAYAGSKFGGIGLTQSFAKELVVNHIKVNSVCPGNYLDGPLWSDPVKGLFVQYLNNGKVPGAKNVEDVREFYMAKVPMHRGCLPSDVARAIMYCVEQSYETGQAIPVTGGQNMLHA